MDKLKHNANRVRKDIETLQWRAVQPGMIKEYERLFGEATLESVATDKGYYSLDNFNLLKAKSAFDVPRISLTTQTVRIRNKAIALNLWVLSNRCACALYLYIIS